MYKLIIAYILLLIAVSIVFNIPYGKIDKYIEFRKSVKLHEIFIIKFDIFEKLYEMNDRKWLLGEDHTEYYIDGTTIKVSFNFIDKLRYKRWYSSKFMGVQNKHLIRIEFISKITAKRIARREVISNNIIKELKMLNDMQTTLNKSFKAETNI